MTQRPARATPIQPSMKSAALQKLSVGAAPPQRSLAPRTADGPVPNGFGLARNVKARYPKGNVRPARLTTSSPGTGAPVTAEELQTALLFVLALYASVALMNLRTESAWVIGHWQAAIELLADALLAML